MLNNTNCRNSGETVLDYGVTGDFQCLRAYATASPFFLHIFWIHFKKIPLCLLSAQRGLPWCWASWPQGELLSLEGKCPFLGMALVEVCYFPLPAVLLLCNVYLNTTAKSIATNSALYSTCHFSHFPAFQETPSSFLHFSFLQTSVILSLSYSSLCLNFLVSKISMSVWSQQQE